MDKLSIPRSNEKGFTLIEVIVSLVLIGILSAMAGLGLVEITQGYVFSRQNSATVQKVQIAMARIVKELGAAAVINSATTTTINYTRPVSITYPTPPDVVTNTITFSGNTVQINGTTLINNVSTFSFEYHDAAGLATATAANIGRIDISLTVTGANNQPSTFTNRIDLMESYW